MEDLLKKYEEGICTASELLELQRILGAGDQSELTRMLENDWDLIKQQNLQLPDVTSKELWQRIHNSRTALAPPRVRRVSWQKVVAIAAAIALLIVGNYYVFRQGEEQVPAAWTHIQNTDESFMIVDLSDGSKLWLNKGSSVRYPMVFSDFIRPIELIGEAFFEVVPDEERPFVVMAKEVQTEVLGTAFNVRAHLADSVVSIALAKGKICVTTPSPGEERKDTTILLPHENLTYELLSKKLIKGVFRGNLPYAWKDQVTEFDGASVQEVVQVLAERYDVEITIPAGLNSESRLVHRFDASKLTIPEVLKGIAKVTNYHFEQKDTDEYIVRLD